MLSLYDGLWYEGTCEGEGCEGLWIQISLSNKVVLLENIWMNAPTL